MTNRLKMAIFLRLTADIFVNPIAIEIFSHELDSLPEQQRHICQLIDAEMSVCKMVIILGIARMALFYRRSKILLKEISPSYSYFSSIVK